MLINARSAEELRIAVVSDAGLENYQVEVGEGGLTRGNIYRGVISNLQPALNAAFVDYGTGKNGFLAIQDVVPEARYAEPTSWRAPGDPGDPPAGQADRHPGHPRTRERQGRRDHHQPLARRALSRLHPVRRHARRVAEGRGRRDPRRAARDRRQARAARRRRRHRAHQCARRDPGRAAEGPRGAPPGVEAHPDRGAARQRPAAPLQRPGPDPARPARPSRRRCRRDPGRRRDRLPAGRRVHAGVHAADPGRAHALCGARAAVLQVLAREPDRTDLRPHRAAARRRLDRRRLDRGADRDRRQLRPRRKRRQPRGHGARDQPRRRRAKSRASSACATSAAWWSSTSSTCAA